MDGKKLYTNIDLNVEALRKDFTNCMDFVCKEFKIGETKAAIFSIAGLINKDTIAYTVLNPILEGKIKRLKGNELKNYLKDHILSSIEQDETDDYSILVDRLLAGFAVLLIDGCRKALLFGVQGFNTRGISEPENETSQIGSREGFLEAYLLNVAMIRRRMRTADFKVERVLIGKKSNTSAAICYLESAVSKELLKDVKKRLSKINTQTVLASGYIAPFLAYGGIFSDVSYTERPDTVCGKISEGRIAIIVDGTPNAIIVPFLFTEYFQSFDDYANRPFFSSFIRILKMIAFIIAVFLPGIYVASIMYHPQMLSSAMLLKISTEKTVTPLSAFSETIITMLLYEIMREAGVRVQKALSGAVSIVGGLVVGEAAVNAQIITSMTLMVVAVSALSSYTVPKLYESIGAVRMILIIAGGVSGFWGIFIITAFLIINTCSQNSFGIPFTAPLSPFSSFAMRDTFIVRGWKKLSEKSIKVQNLPGAKENKNGE